MTVNLKFVQTPAIALYTGLSAVATTARITPYPVDLNGVKLTITDFGNLPTITVDPKISGYEEIISFTGITDNGDNTATLTGLSRNLDSKYPYTGTGTGKTHGASAVIVFSDNPQTFGRLAGKDNDETITGQWTFVNTPIVPGTVSDASTTVKGVSKTSVAPVSASNPIVVGDNDPRVPTQGENDGLAATTTPASSNLFITQKDLQKGVELYAADAGSTDTYAITLAPAPAAYVTGMVIRFKANTVNTGGATLNVNGLGAKAIVKSFNIALSDGDIKAGQFVEVQYDGTNFQMLSPVGSVSAFNSGTLSKDISSNTSSVIAHGLGVAPKMVQLSGSFGNSVTGSKASLFWTSAGGNAGTSLAVKINSVLTTEGTLDFKLRSNWTPSSEDFLTGTITVDATNITISWSKVGTPTGSASIAWVAQS